MEDPPMPLDERLWFEAFCGSRDLIAGNGHTSADGMAAWCPREEVGYDVSLDEMGALSQESRYFVA
jgi:hypothetical protein